MSEKPLKFCAAGPTTLRSALARHADVLAPVHRGALEALAAFATDPQQAARLRHLASPDGRADFQAWAAAPGRTLLEAMQEFPSARPPLGACSRELCGAPQQIVQLMLVHASSRCTALLAQSAEAFKVNTLSTDGGQ